MSDTQIKQDDENESLIWKQFKKRPIGVFSLYVILVLFAVAIYSPLLANRDPLALYTTYGSLYEYYYAGWDAVHDITEGGVQEKNSLQALEKRSNDAYEIERAELKKLTPLYNEAGDRYDKFRTQANRFQDEIDSIADSASGGQSGNELADLEAQRKGALSSAKEAGAEKAEIKTSLDQHRKAQGEHNVNILKSRFRLNFSVQEQALLLNLKQMKFAVDGTVGDKLDALSERYVGIFQKIGSANEAELKNIVSELASLKAEVKASIAPDVVKDAYIYRWTFPVFSSLDGLDRFFASAYPLLLLLLAVGRRVPWPTGKKAMVAVLGGAMFAILTPLLDADLPQRDFQLLLLDNIQAGYGESMAYMAPVPYGMNENRFEEQYQPPSFTTDSDGRQSLHVLGTDDSGRDVLSRMIWGARVSLSVGFVAVGLHLLIGLTVGSIAGFFGGKIDLLLSRLIEIIICFPSFFLILTVIAFVGPSIYNIMIVIGLTGWTGVARLTRGEFLRLRGLDYVIAAEAAGERGYAIIFKHVLPNAMTPILVSAAFGFAGAILVESALSFLGFGVQEPFPSWGQMLAQGRANPLLYWWLFIIPGISLFLTVTFYNLAGNAFRDASDPRLRR